MTKHYRHIIWLAILFVCHFSYGASIADSTVIVSADPPFKENQYLHQAIYYKGFDELRYTIRLKLDIATKDSFISIYDVVFDQHILKVGTHRSVLNIERNDKANYIDYAWLEAVKQYNQLPVGDYRFQLVIKESKSGILKYSGTFDWQSDSTMPAHSDVLGKLFDGKTRKVKVLNQAKRFTADLVQKSTKYTRKRAERIKGISTQEVQRNGATYSAIYYKSWFMGYVLQQDIGTMQSSVFNQQEALKNNPASLVQTSLPQFTSVSSQFKNVNSKKGKAEDEQIEGSVDIIGNFSNGQEPNSAQDNNYQELRGDLHTEILNMPVVIEGYYTTQDRNRKAKASYIRVRYDLEKQKEKLNKEVGNYKDMYERVGASGQGVTNGASALLNQLQQQQVLSAHQFQSNYRISGDKLIASGGDVEELAAGTDSATAAKLRKDKDAIKQRYQQMQETQAKITKYQKLLDQYRNAQYFDSTLNYSKIQDATGSKDYSYKSLVKAAGNILPESKAKSFLSGLTKLNIGILNDYESNYTISGQTLKGLNFGYDLNLFTVGLTAGKTEYVSRNGDVDRYNTYLLKLDFKPVGKQKIGLIYYGYTPTKQILDDPSFTKTDLSVPSFRQPVHIVSLTHSGTIVKGLQMESEAAYSYKNTRANSEIDLHHTAIKSGLQYELPKMPVHLKAEWEHVGKQFENNALPYTRAGIERYTLATDFSLFKSFLKAGIQFNRVQQSTFYSTGYNTKWGFDLQTKSKQYPNLLVSYKPFSTFRRAEDTFAISQRPVFGSVWIARATYQFKRKPANHRFMLSYNRNKSTVDTLSYQSHTLQASYIYTSTKLTFTANSGWSSQPYYMPDGTMLTNSVVFGGVSGSKRVTKQLMVNLGQELAYAGFGLQRRTTTLGLNYRFEKLPFTLYTQCRYAGIRANETTVIKNIWFGQLGVQCRFKTQTPKLKKK